jgi:conjugative relaxase-like TrwC/TraI family protein
MLRIRECKSAGSAKEYYTAHSQADYYIEGHEMAGVWGGKLAAHFGLAGEVARGDFARLCDGLDPRTGKTLLPDKLRTVERRAGYDWTFDAPKSVSLLWEMTGEKAVLDSFRESVRETMDEAELEMKTRVRRGGLNEDRVTGNYVWAGWTHTTTRPLSDGIPDCHLHTHVFVMNLSFCDKEQRLKAGQFGDLKRDAPYWDAAFKARLALKLNALGYATQRDGDSFKVVGLDRDITDKFSRRTKEIEAKIAALEAEGVTLSGAQKDRVGERTRKKKAAALHMTKDELRASWWARLSPGEQTRVVRVANREEKAPERVTPKAAMDYAERHLMERNSTIAEKRLRETALRYGVGSVSVEDVRSLATREGVYVQKVNGEDIATTETVLREEMDVLKMAREGAGTFPILGNGRDGLTRLDGEQRAAAIAILGSHDFLTGLRGGAGTGKTHLMRAAVEALENGSPLPSPKVVVLAPTSTAVDMLRGDGFANAATVESFLTNQRRQNETRGAVIWVDEAGMMGSRDVHRLLTIAKKMGNRVVLSGDYRQHGSVGRGNAMLRQLETQAGVKFAELKTVRRQKDAAYREAVERISEGDIAGGLERFERIGCVVRATGQKRHAQLVKDYLRTLDEGKTALVIAPTHFEGQQVNAKLRYALKCRGTIEGAERAFTAFDSANLTEAQRGDWANYKPGQIVQFMQNAKGFTRGERLRVAESQVGRVTLERENGQSAELPLAAAERFQVYAARDIHLAQGDTIRITQNGVINGSARLEPGKSGPIINAPRERISNGSRYQIAGFTGVGDIRLDNGWVLPKNWGHMRYGLVDTSIGTQSKTVDRVLVAMGAESRGAISREQLYVSASRGREQCRIYMDRPDDVRRAAARSTRGMSAVELMRGRCIEPDVFERNRIGAFLKQTAAAIMRAVHSLTRDRIAGEWQHAPAR